MRTIVECHLEATMSTVWNEARYEEQTSQDGDERAEYGEVCEYVLVENDVSHDHISGIRLWDA